MMVSEELEERFRHVEDNVKEHVDNLKKKE